MEKKLLPNVKSKKSQHSTYCMCVHFKSNIYSQSSMNFNYLTFSHFGLLIKLLINSWMRGNSIFRERKRNNLFFYNTTNSRIKREKKIIFTLK